MVKSLVRSVRSHTFLASLVKVGFKITLHFLMSLKTIDYLLRFLSDDLTKKFAPDILITIAAIYRMVDNVILLHFLYSSIR
jgi:hypothetical protein